MVSIIALFNASSRAISFSVNQGGQISVAATGASTNWAPMRQNPAGPPTYATGWPAPNVIGNLGVNSIQAYVAGVAVSTPPFQFSIPAETPVGSVEIYTFFLSVQTCSWLALIDGKPFAQMIVTGNSIPGESEDSGVPRHAGSHAHVDHELSA
jgi:hypothetical protein